MATVCVAAPCQDAEQQAKQRIEQLGQRGFADEAQADAGQGDAELGAGDGTAQVAHSGINRLGALDAARDQFFDARLADGHQGEFGGHEQAIQGDQSRNRQQAQGGPKPRNAIFDSGKHNDPLKERAKPTFHANRGRPDGQRQGAGRIEACTMPDARSVTCGRRRDIAGRRTLRPTSRP